MRFEHEATINAPADLVWDVYSDVERWPEWTDSITRVQYVDGDTITVGARTRIEQPKLPKAEWEITEVEPGHSWTWASKAPGIKTIAVHEVTPAGSGKTRVRSEIVQSGPLGAIFGRLYAKLTRTYLAMEAAGLKARSEARASA
jgi:uncharacterized membrane protein